MKRQTHFRKFREKDLMKNKHGRIVSKKKHNLGKTKGLKALKKAGWFTRKGEFELSKEGNSQAQNCKKTLNVIIFECFKYYYLVDK